MRPSRAALPSPSSSGSAIHVPELCLVAVDGGTALGWARLGRHPPQRLCRRRRGQRLCCAVIRSGAASDAPAGRADCTVRGARLLDAAGRHFSRERRQRRTAPGAGLPGAGAAPPPRPNELRPAGRTMARRALPGAAQPAQSASTSRRSRVGALRSVGLRYITKYITPLPPTEAWPVKRSRQAREILIQP
jgi:hypothetical protein